MLSNTTIPQTEEVLKEQNFSAQAIEKAFSDFIDKPIWVVTKLSYIETEKGTELKKTNINPKNNTLAECNSLVPGVTFKEACVCIEKNPGYLPAITLQKSLGLTCIDLDNVIEGGNVFVSAKDIYKNANSYAEVSVSGNGLHVFIKATKPGERCKKDGQTEIYDNNKFITLTGKVLSGYTEIKPAQEFLDELYKSTFKEESSIQPNIIKTPSLSDEEVLTLCYKAKNGDKFRVLFEQGDISEYREDASNADSALCSLIAFYTQDEEQVFRLIKQSKLFTHRKGKYPDKWTREGYRDSTIKNAIRTLKNTYQPASRSNNSNEQTSWENPSRIEEGDNLEMDFPLSELPDVLKNAVEEVSKVNYIDPAIVALPGIGITALQIGKKALIQEKEGLEHHPSLFLVGVMASGERKSQGYDSMIKDIDNSIELEEIEYEEKKASVKASNNAILELEKNIKESLRKGELKEDAARLALEDLYKRVQKEPAHPCNYGDDLSPQRLFQKLAAYDGAYGVFSGEGRAILQKILKGSQDGDTGESIYIAGMWGDRIARSRVGSNKGELGGEDLLLRKPALTVTCFVQEDVWEDLSKNKVMRQCGLISRINLVIPKSQMGSRIEAASDKSIDKTRINPFTQAVIRIRKWKPEKTVVVKLSAKAADRRREFFNSIERELAPNGAYEDVKDIATKAISLCARLALIFALLEIANKGEIPTEIPSVTEEQWLKAQSVQEYFLAQAIDAQRTHSKTGTKHLLQKTAKWLQKQKPQEESFYIGASHIVKHVRGATETVVEESIIPDLIKLGWIRVAGQTRKKKPKYEVNPRVFDDK